MSLLIALRCELRTCTLLPAWGGETPDNMRAVLPLLPVSKDKHNGIPVRKTPIKLGAAVTLLAALVLFDVHPLQRIS